MTWRAPIDGHGRTAPASRVRPGQGRRHQEPVELSALEEGVDLSPFWEADKEKEMKDQVKYSCAECGSEDVSGACWVDLNTNRVGARFDWYPFMSELDAHFCNACKNNVQVLENGGKS